MDADVVRILDLNWIVIRIDAVQRCAAARPFQPFDVHGLADAADHDGPVEVRRLRVGRKKTSCPSRMPFGPSIELPMARATRFAPRFCASRGIATFFSSTSGNSSAFEFAAARIGAMAARRFGFGSSGAPGARLRSACGIIARSDCSTICTAKCAPRNVSSPTTTSLSLRRCAGSRPTAWAMAMKSLTVGA